MLRELYSRKAGNRHRRGARFSRSAACSTRSPRTPAQASTRRPCLRWLEAACAAKPRAIFPYGAGLCLRGVTAGSTVTCFPSTKTKSAELLSERIAGTGAAHCMRPGDVLEDLIAKVDFSHLPQASRFVCTVGRRAVRAGSPSIARTLGSLGAGSATRADQAARNDARRAHSQHGCAPSSRALTARSAGFSAWRVVWQLVVHMGRSRAEYSIDFGGRPRRLLRGRAARANYFLPLLGTGAARLLCLGGGAEWLLSAGDERFCQEDYSPSVKACCRPRRKSVRRSTRICPIRCSVYLATREL